MPLPKDKVEEYLDRELPAIAKEIPQITEGPFYGGISHLGHFYMTVVIIALCDEREATMVQSELNVRLKKRIDILAAPYLEKNPGLFQPKGIAVNSQARQRAVIHMAEDVFVSFEDPDKTSAIFHKKTERILCFKH